MAKANGIGGKGVAYTFGVLGFDAAWEPPDLNTVVASVKGEGVASARGAGRKGSGSKKGKRGKPKARPAK
jgi:hypothetical protein